MAEIAGAGSDSGRTDSTSDASCEITSGLECTVDKLDGNVAVTNFNASSKTVFHEKGVVGNESAPDGVETSGSGSTIGFVDGSTEKTDSLGSVRSFIRT